MKILGYEIRKQNRKIAQSQEFRSIYDSYDTMWGGISYSTYSGYVSSKSLTIASCYRAVNLISDAIASLQLKVYKVDNEGYKSEDYTNNLYTLLGFEPNSNMSRFTLFKLIVQSILLRGNAYIKIYRDNNFNVLSLEFINPDLVTISVIKGEIKFSIEGVKGYINNSDMIHIVNFPQMNSFYGLSTVSYAANALTLSYNSESHAANFFQGGANAAGFLSSTAPLTPKQEKDLIDKFKAASNTDTGNPNGIVFMGGAGDIKLQTLGISPKDSQLLETRAFNVLDIARFFSVNPILLFDNTKGTYSNVENANLDFLNTTLLPIIEKIENEFIRKLIRPSERMRLELRFDLSNVLRADSNSRADYFTKLFNLGVVSSNQIAKELNLPKIDSEGADKHFISTNLQDSDNLIVNVDNSIDNQIKPTEDIEDDTKNNDI